MPVSSWEKLPVKVPFPGVEVGIAAGEHVMMNYIHAKKGVSTRRHWHEAEQILCVFKGKVRVKAGDEPVSILGPGDVWHVPANTEHQADYLEDTVAMEGCSPIRLDNLHGYMKQDTYLVEQLDLAALYRKQGGGKGGAKKTGRKKARR